MCSEYGQQRLFFYFFVAIASAINGFDSLRFAHGIQFTPNFLDVTIDGSITHHTAVSINPINQLITTEQLSGVIE
jgi:hypothetical protein